VKPTQHGRILLDFAVPVRGDPRPDGIHPRAVIAKFLYLFSKAQP
jgi:hypothetical protein